MRKPSVTPLSVSASSACAAPGRRRERPRHACRTLLSAALLAISASAYAHGTHGAHGVHQHGLASLEISQQDQTVVIQFRSPLDSLIGFEGKPANDEQRSTAKQLLHDLQSDSDQIFKLPAAAQCTMSHPPKILAHTLTAAPSSGAGTGTGGGAGSDAKAGDDHDHDHDHEHDHGKTGDAHSPKQATADGHAHDHADDHTHDHDDNDHSAGHERDGDDAHSDLSAEYQFICTNVAALSQLQLSVFKHWPRIHSVDAVVVSDKGQKAARLRAKAPVLRW